MTAEDIHKHFGTIEKALNALPTVKPLTRDAFQKWKQNKVPMLRQIQYEQVTNGALKVEQA